MEFDCIYNLFWQVIVIMLIEYQGGVVVVLDVFGFGIDIDCVVLVEFVFKGD